MMIGSRQSKDLYRGAGGPLGDGGGLECLALAGQQWVRAADLADDALIQEDDEDDEECGGGGGEKKREERAERRHAPTRNTSTTEQDTA